MATRAISASKLERALAQTEPSPAALRACQQLMEEEDALPLMRTALRRERAIMDRKLAVKEASEDGDPARATALRFMTEMAEAAKLPEHAQWVRFGDLAREFQQQPQLSESPGVIPNYFTSSFGEQARLRCAATALAVERYRRQHGQWPESWVALLQGDFLKKEPLDPFDGEPLRWRLLADGFLVYSIGPDGKDDGGKIDHLTPQSGADLGFQLWNAPSRRKPQSEAAPATPPKAS